MLKKLLLTIFLINQLAYSQADKNDYLLYSLILSEQLNFGNQGKIDSIILIEKFENKFNRHYEIFDSNSGSISNTDIHYLSISTGNDTVFIKRLIKNAKLRKSIYELTTDFGLNPKISAKLLNSEYLDIQQITSKKYYSFFGRKFKKKHPWKKIEEKYGTRNVIEFSKAKYDENLASVYFGYHCGGLCGNGKIVIFEKVQGVWKILTSINLWES